MRDLVTVKGFQRPFIDSPQIDSDLKFTFIILRFLWQCYAVLPFSKKSHGVSKEKRKREVKRESSIEAGRVEDRKETRDIGGRRCALVKG